MKMNVLKLLIIASLGVSANEASELSWSRLLGSIYTDAKMQKKAQTIDALGKQNYSALWTDLELRYDLDGFDGREHNFELRLTPLAWGERAAKKQRWQSRIQGHKIQQSAIVSNTLADRYRLGLTWVHRKLQQQYHTDMLQIYLDREQVHLALSQTAQFSAEDLVQTQMDILEWKSAVLADAHSLTDTELNLKSILGDWKSISLQADSMLSVTQIQSNMEKLRPKSDSSLPEIAVALQKVKLAQEKYSIEESQANALLSHFSLGYKQEFPESSKKNPPTTLEQLSVGFGIRIPFGDDRKFDLLQYQMDVLDEQDNLNQTRLENTEKMTELRIQLNTLLSQKAILDSFALKVNAGELYADFAKQAGSDPLLLLKAKESALRTAWRSKKIAFDIYYLYIKYLDMAGVLMNDPGTNHLLQRGN